MSIEWVKLFGERGLFQSCEGKSLAQFFSFSRPVSDVKFFGPAIVRNTSIDIFAVVMVFVRTGVSEFAISLKSPSTRQKSIKIFPSSYF